MRFIIIVTLLISGCAFKEPPPATQVEGLAPDPNAFATATFSWSTDTDSFEATRDYRSQSGDEAQSSVPLVIGETAPKQMDVSITFVNPIGWAISQTTFKLIDGAATNTVKSTPTTSGDDGNPLPGGWTFRLDLTDHEGALNKPQLLAIDIYGIKGFETHKRMTVDLLISPKNVTSAILSDANVKQLPEVYRFIEQIEKRRSLVGAVKFSNNEDWPVQVVLPTRVDSSFVERFEHTDVQERPCSHTLSRAQRDVSRSDDVVLLTVNSETTDGSVVLTQLTQALTSGAITMTIPPKGDSIVGLYATGERAYGWARGNFATYEYQPRSVASSCSACCAQRRGDGTYSVWVNTGDAYQFWQRRGWPGASRVCFSMQSPDCQRSTHPLPDPAMVSQCVEWELAYGLAPNQEGRFCESMHGVSEMWDLNQTRSDVLVGDRTVELAVQSTLRPPIARVIYALGTDDPPVERQLPGLVPNRITVFQR